jgi:FkbM family methyltransferase
MSISTGISNPLFAAYSLVRRSGFLRTPLGCRLFKSAYFLYKRYIEDDLHDLVRSHPGLVGDGNILDVGANLGYTAAVLAQAARIDRKVYAFEPEPFNFSILQQTALEHRFKGRIVPQQLAVGAEDGAIKLWINDRHHADHRIATEHFRSSHPGSKEVSVLLVSIDSFLASNPGPVSFVKIDVQGYELAVCQGMQNTIHMNPGISVVLEFMPTAMRELGFESSHLIDFFAEQDFKAYRIHPKGILTPGVPIQTNTSTYFDLLFTRHPIASDRRS